MVPGAAEALGAAQESLTFGDLAAQGLDLVGTTLPTGNQRIEDQLIGDKQRDADAGDDDEHLLAIFNFHAGLLRSNGNRT